MGSSVSDRTEQRRMARRHRGHPYRERWWWIGGAVVLMATLAGIYVAASRPTMVAPIGSKPAGTQTFDEKDRNHVDGPVKYDRTPPAGGNHAKVWLNCGVYDRAVPSENAVHSLEHGAVWITYRSDLSTGDVTTLRALVESKYDGSDRYIILSPYPGLPAPVVATAWGNQLQLDRVSDPRLGGFIDYFRQGPQDLEHGASCAGGVGSPIA